MLLRTTTRLSLRLLMLNRMHHFVLLQSLLYAMLLTRILLSSGALTSDDATEDTVSIEGASHAHVLLNRSAKPLLVLCFWLATTYNESEEDHKSDIIPDDNEASNLEGTCKFCCRCHHRRDLASCTVRIPSIPPPSSDDAEVLLLDFRKPWWCSQSRLKWSCIWMTRWLCYIRYSSLCKQLFSSKKIFDVNLPHTTYKADM